MKKNNLMSIINEYADDYGAEAVLEEFFPNMTVGEIISDAFDAGLIPVDILERFLNDE